MPPYGNSPSLMRSFASCADIVDRDKHEAVNGITAFGAFGWRPTATNQTVGFVIDHVGALREKGGETANSTILGALGIDRPLKVWSGHQRMWHSRRSRSYARSGSSARTIVAILRSLP